MSETKERFFKYNILTENLYKTSIYRETSYLKKKTVHYLHITYGENYQCGWTTMGEPN